jgi:hypothetical protein
MESIILLAQMTFGEAAILVGTGLGAGIAAALGGPKGLSVIIRRRGGAQDKAPKPARGSDECSQSHTALMKDHEQVHLEAEKRQSERYDTILRGVDKLEGGLTRVHERIDRWFQDHQE